MLTISRSGLKVYGILCTFYRKENTEKKGHRRTNCGRCPPAIQEKSLLANSIHSKLRGLGRWGLRPQGPPPWVCSLPADHLPHQAALPRCGGCRLYVFGTMKKINNGIESNGSNVVRQGESAHLCLCGSPRTPCTQL